MKVCGLKIMYTNTTTIILYQTLVNHQMINLDSSDSDIATIKKESQL